MPRKHYFLKAGLSRFISNKENSRAKKTARGREGHPTMIKGGLIIHQKDIMILNV